MEAFEPKWVNPMLNIIGVNSLRLEGLQMIVYDTIPVVFGVKPLFLGGIYLIILLINLYSRTNFFILNS